MTMTLQKPAPDAQTCDNIACRFLSFDNIIEAKHSRTYVDEIRGYHYEGLFEDSSNLIVGPDYSVLIADDFIALEEHVEAYSIGLRSKK